MRNLCLLILTFTCGFASAQVTLIKQGSGHKFIAKADTVQYGPEEYDYYFESISLDIRNAANGALIQRIPTLELPAAPSYYKDEGLLILEDMNFDGHTDFRIMLDYFINGAQTTYTCYLWNETSGKYEMDTMLTGMEGIDVFPEKKIIHSQWRYGFFEFGHAVYEWQGKDLVLLTEEIERWLPSASGGDSAVFIITRNVNSKREETTIPGGGIEGIPHSPDQCNFLR